MDEVQINTISWSAPEYVHKERGNDWYWAIGVITIVACGIALWRQNYVFTIFLFVSGCCLIMFTLRHPQDVIYTIETKGLSMGKDLYEWKSIKSFNIKKNEGSAYAKLLIETSKYFLPVYTIPLPREYIDEVKEALSEVTNKSEIEESKSMVFAEKLGF